MATIKDVTPRYTVAVTQLNTILAARILTDHGDTVVVTGVRIDPEDSSFYLIEIADA